MPGYRLLRLHTSLFHSVCVFVPYFTLHELLQRVLCLAKSYGHLKTALLYISIISIYKYVSNTAAGEGKNAGRYFSFISWLLVAIQCFLLWYYYDVSHMMLIRTLHTYLVTPGTDRWRKHLDIFFHALYLILFTLDVND